MLNGVKGRWWLAAALLVMLFLVAYLPARLLVAFVPAQVSLGGLTGTLWHGSAARASLSSGDSVFMLGTLQWSLDPLSLLTGAPAIRFQTQWGEQRIDATLVTSASGTLRLESVTSTLSVGWVRQLVPLYVEGNIRLDFDHISLRDRQVQSARGRIVWERAAWAARAGVLPLGSFAVDVSPVAAGGVRGEVVTLSGGMRATGSVSLGARDYAVDVSLSGPAMNNEGLQQAIALFAVPDAGDYRIQLTGRF